MPYCLKFFVVKFFVVKFFGQWFNIFQLKQSLTGKELVTLVCGSYMFFFM